MRADAFLLLLFGRWVHVMCAVAVLEAKFVNIAERSPVDVGKIPLQRFRLVRRAWASLFPLLGLPEVLSAGFPMLVRGGKVLS